MQDFFLARLIFCLIYAAFVFNFLVYFADFLMFVYVNCLKVEKDAVVATFITKKENNFSVPSVI